jgi:ring hydroxylating enzyme alpha subunit
MGPAMSSPPRVSPLLASSHLADAQALLDRLLVEHKPGFALPREFQDWDLCERNQAGVNSSAFTPGPYSTKREYNVIRYVDWYLRQISGIGA